MQCPHVPGDVYAQCTGGGGDDVPVQVEGGGGGGVDMYLVYQP